MIKVLFNNKILQGYVLEAKPEYVKVLVYSKVYKLPLSSIISVGGCCGQV